MTLRKVMTETPVLHSLWKSLGAVFENRAGWDLPARFSGAEAEYKAAHHAAILLDRSHHGKIFVRGADHIEVMQNILSQDIAALKSGQSCLAALLSAPGVVLRLMEVYRREGELLMIVEPGLALGTIEMLQRYVITEDVRFEDASHEFVWLALRGPKSNQILSAVISSPQGEKSPKSGDFSATPRNDRLEVFATAWPQDKGINFLIKNEGAEERVQKILAKGKAAGLKPAGYDAAEILRVEAGIPREGADISGEIRLPETGLDDLAASETKGCYPGQEVVARTKTYGGPAKKLVRLEFDGENAPAPGDKIMKDGKEIGWVTSAVFLPGEKGSALGYCGKGFFEKPEEVLIKSTAGEIAAGTLPV